jgi:hypothetical protein
MPDKKIEMLSTNHGGGTHQYVCSCGNWSGNAYHDSDGNGKTAAFVAARRHLESHKN